MTVGVSPDAKHVEAIVQMPQPRDAKEVSTFLGMVNYFHRFIKDCSVVERPLRLLTTKEFKWTEEHTQVFELIKQQLASIPTLKIFNPKLATHVHTDASNVGIGATLIQVDAGMERPVQYFSRTLKHNRSIYPLYYPISFWIVWSSPLTLHSQYFIHLLDTVCNKISTIVC